MASLNDLFVEIYVWGRKNFPNDDVGDIAWKLLEEVGEAIHLVDGIEALRLIAFNRGATPEVFDDSENVKLLRSRLRDEVADVMIVATRLAYELGSPPSELIERKLDVIKARDYSGPPKPKRPTDVYRWIIGRYDSYVLRRPLIGPNGGSVYAASEDFVAGGHWTTDPQYATRFDTAEAAREYAERLYVKIDDGLVVPAKNLSLTVAYQAAEVVNYLALGGEAAPLLKAPELDL